MDRHQVLVSICHLRKLSRADVALEGLISCVLSEMVADEAGRVKELVAVVEQAPVLLYFSLLDPVEIHLDLVLVGRDIFKLCHLI